MPHGEGLALPAYQSADAAGLDLLAAVPTETPLILPPGKYAMVPTGLTIDATTGLISGPISLGAASGSPYATQVTASDGTFSDTQMFTWTVNA